MLKYVPQWCSIKTFLIDALTPLGFPTYLRLWVANMVSNLGTWMHTAAISWIIAETTESPQVAGWMNAGVTLPVMLFSISGGWLADRYRRYDLLLCLNVIMAIIGLTFGIMWHNHTLSTSIIILLSFLLASASALATPAWQATTSSLLPQEIIWKGAILNNVSFNFARALGPTIAAAMIALYLTDWVFFLNSASFFILAWGLFQLRQSTEEKIFQGEITRTWGSLLTILWAEKRFRKLLRNVFICMFCNCVIWTLTSTLLIKHYNAKVADYGAFVACLGIGALPLPWVLNFLRKRFDAQLILCMGNILLAVGCALLVQHLWVIKDMRSYMILVGLELGVAYGIVITILNGEAQSIFSEEMRGRTLSIYITIFYGVQFLGSLCWGCLGEHFSVNLSFWIAALILFMDGLNGSYSILKREKYL